jgi:hypothetical protein
LATKTRRMHQRVAPIINSKSLQSGANSGNFDYHVSFTEEALKKEVYYNYGLHAHVVRTRSAY